MQISPLIFFRLEVQKLWHRHNLNAIGRPDLRKKDIDWCVREVRDEHPGLWERVKAHV